LAVCGHLVFFIIYLLFFYLTLFLLDGTFVVLN
jgi:hypothetical protein